MKIKGIIFILICILCIATITAIPIVLAPGSIIEPEGAITEHWVARYDGPGNFYHHDRPTAITVDSAGNVYVTGTSYSETSTDYATIKYDSFGSELWVARYNGPGNLGDGASALAVDSAGNVYVTGTSYSETSTDYATIKYDTDGNEKWVARYGLGDRVYAIAVDSLGNVYITGYNSYSKDGILNHDYITVKYDSDGNQLWDARYDGPGDICNNIATEVTVDSSGNVYVSGRIWIVESNYDYATVKYDKNGNQLWDAMYDGPANREDIVSALAVDGLGNVYITGYSRGSGNPMDYATVKYDSDGNQLWVERYEGPANGFDYAFALALDSSDNVYVTGQSPGLGTHVDYATVKYDTDGNQLWVARYDSPISSGDVSKAIAVDSLGNVYVTGESTNYLVGHGVHYDYVTVKYGPGPEELIRMLIEEIETWNLPFRTELNLIRKLEAADFLYSKGNYIGAIGKLGDFINRVEAAEGKGLTQEQATYLIAEAQRIINLI